MTHPDHSMQLEPCPFCEGDARISPVETPSPGVGWVASLYRPRCRQCEAALDTYKSLPEAIAAWNRRVGVDRASRHPASLGLVAEEMVEAFGAFVLTHQCDPIDDAQDTTAADIDGWNRALREIAHPSVARRALEAAAALSPAVEAHEEAEAFIQAAIDRAPEPLRRLGEYLTKVLDEDQWKTAERMLLGAASAPSAERVKGLPEPTEEQRKGGWRVNFQYLEKVAKEAEQATGYSATLEVVKHVLLHAAALSPSPLPEIEALKAERDEWLQQNQELQQQIVGQAEAAAEMNFLRARIRVMEPIPEAWELEAAAVFMDHVDDDETGSVHRVAAFLRRAALSPSTVQGSQGGEHEPGTLRVCPKRDAICPHGIGCPYVDGWDCNEPKRALSPQEQGK